jgi:photosystem II stability/assembly factor-like uncharacterized protein
MQNRTPMTRTLTDAVLKASALFVVLILAACQSRPVAIPTEVPTRPVAASPQPTAENVPLLFDGFKMVDGQSGWAWKGISQLYRTDDGGTTWMEIHLFGKLLVAGGFYLDANQAWLPAVPSADITQGIFHTADGGKTWAELSRLHGPNLSLYFHDLNVGWATNGIGAAGNVYYEVYQTTDGGVTWNQLQATGPFSPGQGPAPGALHTETGDTISFQPPETIWITSGIGATMAYAGLIASRDGGKTWDKPNLPLPPEYIQDHPPVIVAAPQFTSQQDAYLPVTVGGRLVFFFSRDGGQSWKLLPPVMPAADVPPRVQFVNMEDGFAVCVTNLCVTKDGGATWQAIPTPFAFGPTQNGSFVSQFQFVDAGTGWAIVSDQNGPSLFVETTDGGRTWTNRKPRLGF